MISMEKIDHIWSSIVPVSGQNIARRADADHPLDCFLGYNEREKMQMMLLSDEELAVPESSRQVLVRENRRSDGKYAICFILENPSLRETFVTLCWDIMSCTSSAANKHIGNEAAVKRFGIWLIMLAKSSESKLTENKAKGLLGELLVLQKICAPFYGYSKAINGWVGPLQADRDFEYEEIWYESKAVSSSGETISISSFDQLDIDIEGKLVICRLDKTGESDPTGISLKKIEKQIHDEIGLDEDTYSTFMLRLTMNGYKADAPHADDMFLFKGFERFAVGEDFPRIRKRLLAPAIKNGEYSLEIEALNPWREMQEE